MSAIYSVFATAVCAVALNGRQVSGLAGITGLLPPNGSVMLAMWYFHIEPALAFMLTTQGFILLYGAAILAFMKQAKGSVNHLIGLGALGCWCFLIQGFGWLILYPLSLFMVGIARTRYINQAKA